MARIARQEAAMCARLRSGQDASTSQAGNSECQLRKAKSIAGSGTESEAGGGGGVTSTAALLGTDESRRRLKAEASPKAELSTGADPDISKKGGKQKLKRKKGASLEESLSPEAPVSPPFKPKKRMRTATKSDSSAAAAEAAAAHSHAEPAAAAEGPQWQVHIVQLQGAAQKSARVRSTPRTGWWGAGRFVPAGCLEGIEQTAKHAPKQRQTFDEKTQEDLYMAAHEGKVANNQGLGSASAPSEFIHAARS
jgi:hypothetical protein